tara:strand:+ start:3662 stop:3979 length:318 start_codon:yes stop_codon:yes gene_type:complete
MKTLKIEKNKKTHTGCDHPESFHEEGLCWKITNPELENEPTDKKYCPCSEQKGLTRRYARTGYMEAGKHDQMITKKCDVCSVEFLFKIDTSTCLSCKAQYKYNPN